MGLFAHEPVFGPLSVCKMGCFAHGTRYKGCVFQVRGTAFLTAVIVPQGYVAEKSSHTRGSTVDLTLFDMTQEREVDMGCTFDYFGRASHPDVRPGEKIGAYPPINEAQYSNRMILREAMLRHGFKPYDCEWWHFTLRDEPYPDTYFTFPLQTKLFAR